MPIMEIDQIDVSAIRVGVRLRRVRPEVVKELVASITEIGLLHPLLVSPENNLIAGLHRLEAVRVLGWEKIPAHRLGEHSRALRLAEIDENLARADLSPAERAAHQAERKKLYEEEHPETRSVLVRGGPGRGNKTNDTVSSVSYAEKAAKTQGTSERTVQREAARGAAILDVASLAGTSLDTPKELDALASMPPEAQAPLIAKAKEGGKVSASQEVKAQKRQQREKDLGAATIAASTSLGSSLYNVIYADPPWRFEPWSRETGMDRAADNHYPTMTIDRLSALEPPAADDCVLFLWATAPMLPEALSVMKVWGFSYKSHCVWVKPRIGTGYWFRNAHELLLVGTRGNVPAPSPGTQMSSVIEEAVGRHSEKPLAFAEMIERLFPNSARLEMFARSGREGWASWGNEADGQDHI